MRHWTQDGAHGVATALAVFGIGGVVGGVGWPSLAMSAVGAILLAVLRALETRDGFMQAVRAETNSQATQAELEAVKARLSELEKPSLTSRVGSGRIAQSGPQY